MDFPRETAHFCAYAYRDMQDGNLAARTTAAYEAAKKRDRTLTQAKIAKAIGMTQPRLSLRLAGQIEWKAGELQAFATYLGVDVETLEPLPPPADMFDSEAGLHGRNTSGMVGGTPSAQAKEGDPNVPERMQDLYAYVTGVAHGHRRHVDELLDRLRAEVAEFVNDHKPRATSPKARRHSGGAK